MWMNSLPSKELSRLFRLHTEIYQEDDLLTCLTKLSLKKTDLIITNAFLLKSIKATNAVGNSVILNVDAYGLGEPKEEWVNEILCQSNLNEYQRVIAIGGGAVIDIAKLCVFGDGRNVQELYNDKLELTKKRELIVMPSTCGTGSEVTSVSVVEFSSIQSKLGLQIDALFCDKAVLISELLETLPYRIFVYTSIDAIAHAIESLLSPKANPYTDMFARSAIEGIIENFKAIRGKNILPDDISKSLICSNMAGIAFSIAGCATMHALSFPLGANCHLAHGEAIYSVFEETLKYYQSKQISLNKLENVLKPLFEGKDLIEELCCLLSDVYPRPDLNLMDISEEDCVTWGMSVYENQQRLLINSPYSLNSNDLETIYKNCIL